jgi:hypothetical protein
MKVLHPDQDESIYKSRKKEKGRTESHPGIKKGKNTIPQGNISDEDESI